MKIKRKVEIALVAVTVLLSHVVIHNTNMTALLPDYILNTYIAGILLPGVFAGVIYSLYTKEIWKILGIGVVTSLIWCIWFVAFALLTYKT